MKEDKFQHKENEIINCANDFNHFAENWVKIYHPARGLIPFKLYVYQERLLNHYENNRFTILTKFRQGGFTTTTLLWMLWRCMFKLDECVMYTCKTDAEAVMGGDIIKKAIKNLPDWLYPKLKINNAHRISFEDTGSEIFFTTTDARYGRSIKWLILDECAFIPKMSNHWKAIYPTLSCGGNCITMSTPNKNSGWFFDTYTNAEAGKNSFSIYKAIFTEHPDYNNHDWVKEVKANLGVAGWSQEILQSFMSHLEADYGK